MGWVKALGLFVIAWAICQVSEHLTLVVLWVLLILVTAHITESRPGS